MFIRIWILSIFNYLTPVIQTVARVGFEFTHTQVLPRILAAATATVQPRSQQRDPNINIVIAPLINPHLANVITHQSSNHRHGAASESLTIPETPSTPSHVPRNQHRPTSVILYTVIVVPPPAEDK